LHRKAVTLRGMRQSLGIGLLGKQPQLHGPAAAARRSGAPGRRRPLDWRGAGRPCARRGAADVSAPACAAPDCAALEGRRGASVGGGTTATGGGASSIVTEREGTALAALAAAVVAPVGVGALRRSWKISGTISTISATRMAAPVRRSLRRFSITPGTSV